MVVFFLDFSFWVPHRVILLLNSMRHIKSPRLSALQQMAKEMSIDSDEEVVPETSSDEEGDKAHFTQYTKSDAGPTALVGCMPTPSGDSGQVNAALDTAQRKSLAPAWSVVTAAASTLKDMLDPRTSSITLKVLSLPPPTSLPPSLLSLHTYIDTRFIHFTE